DHVVGGVIVPTGPDLNAALRSDLNQMLFEAEKIHQNPRFGDISVKNPDCTHVTFEQHLFFPRWSYYLLATDPCLLRTCRCLAVCPMRLSGHPTSHHARGLRSSAQLSHA